jgi:hypothetical protein
MGIPLNGSVHYSSAVTESDSPAQNQSVDWAFEPAVIRDRVEAADELPTAPGPAWNRRFQIAVDVLAIVMAILTVTATTVTIHQPLRETPSLLTGTGQIGLSIAAEVAFLSLYVVGIVWIIMVGRHLRTLGRAGAHLRLVAVGLFMAIPLALCATNLFANDAGAGELSPSAAELNRDAIFACVVRVVLALCVVVVAAAVRRGTDRLMAC